MTPETEKRLRDLADSLRGSCRLLDDEERDLVDEAPEFFDTLVFCCEECGWWCGEDEYGRKDMHCDECSPTEDDGFPEDDDDADSDYDSDDEDDEDG